MARGALGTCEIGYFSKMTSSLCVGTLVVCSTIRRAKRWVPWEGDAMLIRKSRQLNKDLMFLSIRHVENKFRMVRFLTS